jgi:hypothetical protein
MRYIASVSSFILWNAKSPVTYHPPKEPFAHQRPKGFLDQRNDQGEIKK